MQIDWLDPWHSVEAHEAERLGRELRREIGPRHELHGVPFSIIGRRKDRDAVLLQLRDGTHRAAVVQLTWRMGEEIDPRWPATRIYKNQREWEDWGLSRDHEDWWSDQAPEDLAD